MAIGKDIKTKIYRLLGLVFGALLLALNYNLFLLPHNLVIGGTSGLSIIFQDYVDPTLFINVSTIFLLIISYILLGKKYTGKTILGSLLFLLFVNMTNPLCKIIVPMLNFEEFFVTIILVGIVYGVANGIIFKSGYNTGGTDVIIQILTKYLKMPSGKSSTIINAIIVLLGGLSFGIPRVIYAFFVLFIGANLMDRIMIGISDSKVFYIYTKESSKLRDIIIEQFKTGYTMLPTLGGYSHDKGHLLMCVVNTKDYYEFKEIVLEVDPDAFVVVNDCYDVNGGVKKKNLPFM